MISHVLQYNVTGGRAFLRQKIMLKYFVIACTLSLPYGRILRKNKNIFHQKHNCFQNPYANTRKKVFFSPQVVYSESLIFFENMVKKLVLTLACRRDLIES